MKKLWKPIIPLFFRNRYEVSNFGELRSKSYKLIDSLGRIYHKKSKVLKLSKDSDGYSIISLSKNGVSKTFKVHYLVASAFILNKYKKPLVNHLDGIKTNNKVGNLEWSTHRENVIHSFKVLKRKGFSVSGAAHPSSKIVEQHSKDRILIKIWPSIGCVEKYLGFDTSSISKVCNGKKRSYKGFIWRYKDDKEHKF